MKIFSIVVLIVISIEVIFEILKCIRFKKTVQTVENKVKIKNVTRRKFCIHWCILSLCWILISFGNREDYLYRKDYERSDAYNILMIVWATAFVWRFIAVVLNSYDYITKDGIFQPEWKIFIDRQKVEYQLESDGIKIYYAKKRFVNYELPKVPEFSGLLEGNYILHTENNIM